LKIDGFVVKVQTLHGGRDSWIAVSGCWANRTRV